ncbi:hypothetical protein NWP22_17855 [Anabaenopsis tanganyikae CS-531]|uniref:Uncharacterized protein n=2 Tax=Anabaenopsis TaxID=110103 RepID=A0ABT5AWI3_9CYAN|nr:MULTISPECIES: hypothetical protein [Anabaenopsis]MDB9540786.1 hypothetical protein [Anabaenopsis arnoldii]MDH6093224.1 hypothetical protein [Anabaenopsis arnoldii]MDH6107698.1 hypothetical protein [Anabaenopsis tanganyikae CS-531]
MELSDEEKEIIRRYRLLSDAEKKSVRASETAFKSWIESAIPWVLTKIIEIGISEILHRLISLV